MTGWPSAGVVVPSRDRPAGVRAAAQAILGQDYAGELAVVVVFDGTEPDDGLADLADLADLAGDRRQIMVLANRRAPGLAGARNTGILALDTDLVAFCDDDDQWLPGKLTSQVRALLTSPGAEFVSCGVVIRSGGRSSIRTAGRAEVSHSELVRSRMVMVHSSTYLASRSALLDGIGLVDESIPGSQCEDWDLALRAARRRPIVIVDEPLVRVTWSTGSHYERQWESKVAGLRWMLAHHPDIAASRRGAARVYAQIAFGYACLGRRGEACRWAARAMRSNWHERRLPFVAAVASGVLSGDRVLAALHARGHGI